MTGAPLDQLESKDTTIFNNKIGGSHTTPFFYIGIVLFCVFGFLFGLLGFIIGVPFLLSSSWVSVNVNRRMMCRYYKVCGIKFGADNWQPIPPINAVTVTRAKYTQTLASRGSQTTFSDFVYKVQLAGGGRNVWPLLTCEKKEEAILKANFIAGALDAKVVDYSSPSSATRARRR